MVISEYSSNFNNVSIVLRDKLTNPNEGAVQVYFNSKENADTTKRPYLNITYTRSLSVYPSATGVRVLPQNPNAGQDLLCNYTYTSPKNYTEQNSSFKWFKNGTDQNINAQLLSKTNLTVNDMWGCEVTVYDGLDFGDPVSSTNSVIVLDTVGNVTMFVNGTNVSQEIGYFSDEKQVIDFSEKLNDALANCTADSEGFCTIPMTFSSNNIGVLNLSDINLFYTETTKSLSIKNLTAAHSNGTTKIFEIQVLNDGNYDMQDISWQLDTNDNNITNSTQTFSLGQNDNMFIYMAYAFGQDGDYNVKVNISNTDISVNKSLFVSTRDIDVSSLVVVNESNTKRIFEFVIKNLMDNNLTNVTWSFDTKNSNIINSTLFNTILQSNEEVFVYIDYNFTTTGVFNTNATAINGTLTDSKNLTITI